MALWTLFWHFQTYPWKSDAGFTKTINFADITWQDKSNVSWDIRESMSVKDILCVIGLYEYRFNAKTLWLSQKKHQTHYVSHFRSIHNLNRHLSIWWLQFVPDLSWIKLSMYWVPETLQWEFDGNQNLSRPVLTPPKLCWLCPPKVSQWKWKKIFILSLWGKWTDIYTAHFSLLTIQAPFTYSQ